MNEKVIDKKLLTKVFEFLDKVMRKKKPKNTIRPFMEKNLGIDNQLCKIIIESYILSYDTGDVKRRIDKSLKDLNNEEEFASLIRFCNCEKKIRNLAREGK